MRLISTGLLMVTSMCLTAASAARLPDGMSGDDFFLQRIRPILVDQCWRCHGPRKQRNGLRLDSRDAVLQGGHVADVDPGHPETSRLIDAIGYEDGDLQMPPDAKLSDGQIADFATWVRLGVPWADPKAVPAGCANHAATGGSADARGRTTSAPAASGPRPLAPWYAILARLHPVLVHFPIALITAAALGEGASIVATRRRWKDRAAGLTVAVRCMLMVGGAGAVVAAMMGWLAGAQSHLTGEPAVYLTLHRWLGTAVAVVAAALGVWAGRDYAQCTAKPHVAFQVSLAVCALLVGLVGHLGGSLTYGIGWLTASP